MTTQDRTVVMVVICVVLAAAGWFLAIKPKRADVASVKTQVEQAQVAADQAAASAVTARSAKAGYQEDYATVVRLGKAVPVEDDVASLVYQLESTADDTGVDFRSVTVAEGASAAPTSEDGGGALPGQVTQVPITLSFDGGYFAMTRFLRKIDRYTLVRNAGNDIDVRGRLLAVGSVKLTPGASGFPDVQAEVSVTAYRAPLPEVDGTGAAGSPAASAASDSSGAAPSTAAPANATDPSAAQPSTASNTAGGDAQ